MPGTLAPGRGSVRSSQCHRHRHGRRIRPSGIYRAAALASALAVAALGRSPPSTSTSSTSTSSTSSLLPPFAAAFSVERTPDAHGAHRIVFGTAALSRSDDPMALLDAAYSKGFRRFDLAHTYGAGESERIFGRWLASRSGNGASSSSYAPDADAPIAASPSPSPSSSSAVPPPRVDRAELDLITKGGIGDDKYGDPDRPILTRTSLRAEMRASLEALGTDHVDLYMFHRDDARLPVGHFVEWINEALAEGWAREWGCSNWSFSRFREAHRYALRKGLRPPRANSPQFSLAVPDGEIWPSTTSVSHPDRSDEIDWYQDRDIELLCWEVLAKGFMAKADLWPEGQIDIASLTRPVERGTDEWRTQRIQRAYCHGENYRRRGLAIELAGRSGCRLAQVAMLYPLSRGDNISVIFGSADASHLDDMAGLRHLRIDEEAMGLLADGGTEVVAEQKEGEEGEVDGGEAGRDRNRFRLGLSGRGTFAKKPPTLTNGSGSGSGSGSGKKPPAPGKGPPARPPRRSLTTAMGMLKRF